MTMADVDKLLHEFIEEDRAGGTADPVEYLQRVEATDRAELEALIDGYLARAPRRPFDRAAFDRSPARAVAEELGRALGGASGTWPALLPRLRHRARLRRSEVVARLAEELGAAGAQADKVAGYYHRMEQGTLPAAGVSDRVLEALGRVVGVTLERLREAGRSAGGPPPSPAAAGAFARVGSPDPKYVEAGQLVRDETPGEPRDEIDALFTGASAREP
jgi:choline dehydrogenase-like flavoprotein